LSLGLALKFSAAPLLKGVGGGRVEQLRALILAGGVTTLRPMVAIGDSHTDDTTAAQYLWDDLQAAYNKPGEGLEGVASAAIVPKGNNGQLLSNYLTGAGPNTFAAAMALNPSVVVPCWLTNDVRLGGLGLTVEAVTANGAALLNQLIADIKTSVPDALIVLRIPAPYLTVNTGGLNYIQDGSGNINPAGLAQIYTTGVRAAYYAAAAGKRNVMIYDPQSRLFGVTSPVAVGTNFADQIHQNQVGYEAEAQDFANWVAAAVPYSQALTDAALISQPYTPWLAYNRAVEDTSRFVQISSAYAVTITAPNTYADFGPSVPDADPTLIAPYDIMEPTASQVSFRLPSGAAASASAANTRVTGLAAITASAVAKTHTKVFRQTRSGDAALNAALDAARAGGTFLKTGRIGGGSTSFMDIGASSLTAIKPTETAAAWVPNMLAGDKVYVEGRGGTPITLTSNFAASGSNCRVTGLAGFDYSTIVGRIAIVVR